jgi:tRNA(fMet)-specific endonuclease VapC
VAVIAADSDVLIDALRGKEPVRTRIAEAIQSRLLATTAITFFELLSGASSPREQKKVETLLAVVPVLPVDQGSAILAAEIRRGLERRGRGIGFADYLIAGICLSRSIPLMTRNRDHFGRIEGLELIPL